jgi:hypothetical protein
MLDLKHAGYRPPEGYPGGQTAEFRADPLERIIRMILVICFLGVLGLELWLLVSALGVG